MQARTGDSTRKGIYNKIKKIDMAKRRWNQSLVVRYKSSNIENHMKKTEQYGESERQRRKSGTSEDQRSGRGIARKKDDSMKQQRKEND